MRDDLTAAEASANWAEAQIPDLQERFLAWQRSRPYEIVMETDPHTAEQLLVARRKIPLDPLISPQVGCIINSARSSLDLLAAALACRNGVKPSATTHFPFYASHQDFIDPLKGIVCKKWLSTAEKATFKSIAPYDGGDEVLWTL